MGGDGGCRVGKVRAGATSPMPNHKGFKLQELVNFQKCSTLRYEILFQHICALTKLHFCEHIISSYIQKLQMDANWGRGNIEQWILFTMCLVVYFVYIVLATEWYSCILQCNLTHSRVGRYFGMKSIVWQTSILI